MEKHPSVAYIEEDVALRRSDIEVHDENDAIVEGKVPWNLDRLDQHEMALDNSYNPEGDGENVDIYVIDTGVRATHQDLKGRVHYAGFDAVDHLTGSNNHGKDCNGHGTHCAGTAAGSAHGVAKKANIYNLRALNCEGTGAVSGIVMGINKIVEHKQKGGTGRPIVISQSLGVKKSRSLNGAIEKATDAGITCVGAAGNQGAYSCSYSPASAKMSIAVGATDKKDGVTSFTNTGECTTIMAPGTQITSASNKCDTCTKTMSGTSMAAPHVAGYAAIVLSENPRMTPAEVKAKMITQSTKDCVMMSSIAGMGSHSTPNRLLYVRSAQAAREDTGRGIASIQGFASRP
jgi:subtilisin family serine protease